MIHQYPRSILVLVAVFLGLDAIIVGWSGCRAFYFLRADWHGCDSVSLALLYSLYSFLDPISIPSLFCQSAILSLWCGFDRRYAPWRWLASMIFAYFCCKLLKIHLFISDGGIFAILLISSSLVIAVLWFLRLCGLKVIRPNSSSEEPRLKLGRFQFSLIILMEWMTAITVIFGLGCSISRYGFLKFDRSIYWNADLLLTLLSMECLLTLSTLWFVMGDPRKKMSRIQLFGLLFVSLGILYLRHDNKLIAIFTIQFFMLILSLWAIRRAGYGMEWHRNSGEIMRIGDR